MDRISSSSSSSEDSNRESLMDRVRRIRANPQPVHAIKVEAEGTNALQASEIQPKIEPINDIQNPQQRSPVPVAQAVLKHGNMRGSKRRLVDITEQFIIQ